MCAGLFYRWNGNDSAGASSFLFYNETLALPAHTGASIVAHGPGGDSPFPVFGAGDWTLQNGPSGAFTYLIDFSGGPTVPALGVFSYDPNTPSFSNFAVFWDGILFDLTDAANAPVVGGACAGADSSPRPASR